MMESNKNQFDDIILERSNKNEKIKKILMRIIALIILFLIIMIVMKLINSSGEENIVKQSILPSEPLSVRQDSSADHFFQNMPITDNNLAEDQFEALRRQIQGEQKLPSDSIVTQNTTNETKASLQSLSEEPSKENLKEEKEQATLVSKEQSQPQKTDANELFKSVDIKPAHPNDLASGTYVQIFSIVNLDEKSRELVEVRQKGYDYKLYKTNVNGKEITKVLIGPFEQANLATQLAKIRKEVAKDAFSFTIK